MDAVHSKLAQLRDLVELARSMPMSSTLMIDRAKIVGLLEELTQVVEAAFTESQRVMADRDGVVDEGRQQADLIIRDAQNERDRLVSDTEVYRLARHQAEALLSEAKSEAEALRVETDEYVDAKLANFEVTLERTLDAVRRGRERLSGTTTMHGITPEAADEIVLPDHLEG